jgi:hypothetical protein
VEFCFTKPASFDDVIRAVFDLLRRDEALGAISW